MDPDETVKIMVPGQVVLDRFKLVRRIGRGGMGIVWLAQDQTLSLEVALKFLPEAVRSDPAALDDLKSEARKSIRLAHPNIVRIHDFIEAPEAAGISMEFVDGATLAQLRVEQKDKVFETADLAGWLVQLCDSLNYAHHDAKLVHRDLKPGNLMVAKDGRLKVADFGISRSLSDTINRVTKENVVAGTLAYMGPQQLYGEKPDPRDDIYSIGATLFDLLTGKPPFYSGDITAQIESKRPPTVTERRREFDTPNAPVPPEWETTISACLDKDPAKRPQTVSDLAARLKLPTSSVAFIPGSTTAGSGGPMNYRQRLLTAFLCLILIAFLVDRLIIPSSDPTQQTADSSTAQEATPTLEQETGRGPVEFLADRDRMTLPALPGQAPAAHYTNSIGMTLLPLRNLYCSLWETRARDYQSFMEDSDYEPHPGKTRIMTEDGWSLDPVRGWNNPGFEQAPDHPVCCVSAIDALKFCDWLTEKEQTAGLLKENQYYRLPFGDEWADCAGPHDWPWEPELKPQGNFAGAEAAAMPGWQADRTVLRELNDGHPRTAPVGLFQPSAKGLFDLGGNVWEWCLEASPVLQTHLRGGSWDTNTDEYFLVENRVSLPNDMRNATIGFRIVLVESGEPVATRE